jgi:transcriptional regulator with XRE-family HTH domain
LSRPISESKTAGRSDQPRRHSRGRTSTGQPNPIDVHVGARIRLRRTLLSMSQGKLGESIGLTFQQIQKYERGDNRVSASRLYDFSKVLGVPIAYFFEDMPEEVVQMSPRNIAHAAEDLPDIDYDPMTKRETLELVRAYYSITDMTTRGKLTELVNVLADANPEGK